MFTDSERSDQDPIPGYGFVLVYFESAIFRFFDRFYERSFLILQEVSLFALVTMFIVLCSNSVL